VDRLKSGVHIRIPRTARTPITAAIDRVNQYERLATARPQMAKPWRVGKPRNPASAATTINGKSSPGITIQCPMNSSAVNVASNSDKGMCRRRKTGRIERM
jgi:hypothetical protein